MANELPGWEPSPKMWDTRPTAPSATRPQRKRFVQNVGNDEEAEVVEHKLPRDQFIYMLSPAGNVVAETFGSNRMLDPTQDSRYQSMVRVALTQGFIPWNFQDWLAIRGLVRGTAPKMVRDFRKALTIMSPEAWMAFREETQDRRRKLHTKERSKDAAKIDAMAKEELSALVKTGISEGIRAGLSVAADTAAKDAVKTRKAKGGEETP